MSRSKEEIQSVGRQMCRVHLVVSKCLREDVNRKDSGRTQATATSKAHTEVEELTREAEKQPEKWEEAQESLGQGRSCERPAVKESKSC